MDKSSSEVSEQPIVTDSVDKVKDHSNNQSNEDKTNSQSTSSGVKTQVKENSLKYKTVESRYKQSTQNWVNKRSEDSHNSQTMSSRPPSRNPTPERKKTTTKSSTPLSTDKSLNVSGISVINKVKENKDPKPSMTKMNKYTKPLITGRKSIAPKRLPFDPDSNYGKSGPLTVMGLENQTRNKDFEESIKRSIYLQTVFLNLKAEQSRKVRKADAFETISGVWKQTNEMRDKLTQTHQFVHNLEQLIQTIYILENQKSHLQRYLDIRSKVDPLFNQLSELIGNQKRILKIENCFEKDFHKMIELLENCPNGSERLETLTKATIGPKRGQELENYINSMEKELKKLLQSFDYCVKQLEKYEVLEKEISPEKSLSLKKLF